MKNLAITPRALFKLSNYTVTENWFGEFYFPDVDLGIKRIAIGGTIFILESENQDEHSPLILINNSTEDGVFSGSAKDTKNLERIITVARSVFTDSVTIPPSWKPHYEGEIFSISAKTMSNWRGRLHFASYQTEQAKSLHAFNLSDDIVDFRKLKNYRDQYEQVREDFIEAILTEGEEYKPNGTDAGIVLTQRLPQGFLQGGTLDVWYQSRLTKEQREFVDKGHDNPVRLRGAAGTGKTLSLVIKFLRDGSLAEKNRTPIKFGFLTHSKGSVDFVNAICESLDPLGLTLGAANYAKLEIRTLYDLASEYLHLADSELSPLELDGRKGRNDQKELIAESLQKMWDSSVIRARFSKINSNLLSRWNHSDHEHKLLIEDIANEFASVIDAEGIKHGTEKAEKYAKSDSRRPAWLMELSTELDRRFILEVHNKYCDLLAEMNSLSIDQMIADLDSYLDTNRWSMIRDRMGYDALFVDELHLFTAIERQSLHKLIRFKKEGLQPSRPAIFMAYDIKQSPTDSFTNYHSPDGSLFSASTQLQNSDLVKLDKIFRYTPEIAEFLRDIDASFPAIDIPGEWDAYVGDAQLPQGSKPTLKVYDTEKDLMRAVFETAHDIARRITGGGRRVAVLCISEEMFDTYSSVAKGQYPNKFITISGREPSSEFRYAGKRFIFSMPEYVAGLQFDTVLLIHADVADAPIGAGIGVRRRFISSVYLGASRAENTLTLHVCSSRGGPSDILNMSLERGNLIEI
jgi:hypothetical protein